MYLVRKLGSAPSEAEDRCKCVAIIQLGQATTSFEPNCCARATSESQTKGSARAASQRIWLAQPEKAPQGLRVPDSTYGAKPRSSILGDLTSWE